MTEMQSIGRAGAAARAAFVFFAAFIASSAANASDIDVRSRDRDILVTAQKREERARDVSITINAIGGGDLNGRGVSAATDLEQLVPGLTVTRGAATGIPVFTIRGAGFVDFSAAASSTVGLYADGSALPYAVMGRGLLFDLERVEVLKGPQGDLYGRNATAGQLNFISNKPATDLTGSAILNLDSFGVRDLETSVNGPMSSNVQARLAARLVQSDQGWQKSISRPGDRLGARDEAAIRALANIDFSAGSLLFNVHWDHDRSENAAPTAYDGAKTGLTASQPRPTAVNATPFFSVGDNRAADWSNSFRPRRDNVSQGVSAKLDWDIEDGLNLISLTAFDHFDRDERVEGSGVSFQDNQSRLRTNIDSFAEEVRLSSNALSDLYWLAGAYYSRDALKERVDFGLRDSYFGLALGANSIATRFRQESESIAAFGHLEWTSIDPFVLTLGARYTSEEKTWAGCTYDAGDGSVAGAWNTILTPFLIIPNGLPNPGPLTAGGCAVYDDVPGTLNFGRFAIYTAETRDTKLTWKASLGYHPAPDFLLYASASEGFKSGGFNGASAQTFSQVSPYRPETLVSYETGLKTALLDRSLSLNFSIFYNDYANKQETTVAITPVGNIPALTNIPKSKSYGAELEGRWKASDRIEFGLSAAYLQTKILDYEAINDAASVFPNRVTRDATGFELPNAPQWQVNASAAYEWLLPSDLVMHLEGEVAYKDKSFGTSDQKNPISAYVVTNARLTLDKAGDKAGDRYSMALWGRNIFNEYYWTAAFVSTGLYARNNGSPATFGLTLTAKY